MATAAAFLLVAPASPRADAQVISGSIVGRVLDPSGASLPKALVVIRNQGTGAERQMLTNSQGDFSFPSLQAGVYEVHVSKSGFASDDFTGENVAVDQVVRVDATLKLGSVTQKTVVRADAAHLQTDSAQLRTEINGSALHNLPVPIDKNFESLLVTVPGITPPDNSSSYTANPARGLQFNTNGTTANSNDVRIDGVSANNLWLPNVASYVPSRHAIETVSVVTNSFEVSQGVAGGAAINAHIRSGTNNIHGQLYENDLNNAIAARPYAFNAVQAQQNQRKPKLIDNDLGGVIGGPIVKNKFFYFASYEGDFLREAAQRTVTIPTAAMINGDFSGLPNAIYDPATGDTADCQAGGNPKLCGTSRTQFAATPAQNAACTSASPTYNSQTGACANMIPTDRLDAETQMIEKLLLPKSGPNLPGYSNNYFASGDFASNRDTYDGKVDYQVTPNLRIFGHLGLLHFRMHNPPIFGNNGEEISTTGYRTEFGYGNVYNVTLGGTDIVKPNFVIDAHMGMNISNDNSEPANLSVDEGTSTLNLPGTNGPTRDYGGWPAFLVSGFAELGSGGNSNTDVIRYFDHTYLWNADGNWIKSAHTVKFGGMITRGSFNHFEESNASGTFNFSNNMTALNCAAGLPSGTKCPATGQANAYAGFVLGLPSSVSKDFLPFNNGRVIAHFWQYTAYLRDQWQALPGLTVNYGVSWNYFPMGTRGNGLGFSRYDFATNQVAICGKGGTPINCGYNISKLNFSPAAGVAWRVRPSFVVRIGAGMTYDPEPLAYIRDMFGDYPENLSETISSPVSTFASAGALSDGIAKIVVPDISSGTIPLPSKYGFTDLTSDYHRDYMESWNLSLEKQLSWGWIGQASYVGTRQVKVPGLLNLNVGQVGGGTASEPFNQLYGNTNTINLETPVNHVHYDALQARLDHAFAQGFQLGVAYTWSKVIGYCCNSLADGGPAVQLPQYSYLNRGLEPWDRTQNLEMSWVAELPFGRGKPWLKTGLGSALAGGWQLNGIASFYSGSPFTVTSSGTSLDAPGNSQTANLVGTGPVKILGGIGTGSPYFDTSRFAPVTTAAFGTAGYDILRGPGVANTDFSLFRKFNFVERTSLRFEADAYNLANTPHFSGPSGNASSSGFGYVTSTHATGREGLDQRVLALGFTLDF